MNDNWAFNLDFLARNGVLDFDAPSYIMGTNPRYIGKPDSIPKPFADSVPKAPALNQPNKDEYSPQKQDNNFVKNPSWKKWLFGALAIGGTILGICKFKTIKNWTVKTAKNALSKFKWGNIKGFFVNKAKAVGNFFKNCGNKIKGWFH